MTVSTVSFTGKVLTYVTNMGYFSVNSQTTAMHIW